MKKVLAVLPLTTLFFVPSIFAIEVFKDKKMHSK